MQEQLNTLDKKHPECSQLYSNIKNYKKQIYKIELNSQLLNKIPYKPLIQFPQFLICRRNFTKTHKNLPTEPNPLPRLFTRPHAHAEAVPTVRSRQQPALRLAPHRPPQDPQRGIINLAELSPKLSAGFHAQ